jgi:hypothetical protein
LGSFLKMRRSSSTIRSLKTCALASRAASKVESMGSAPVGSPDLGLADAEYLDGLRSVRIQGLASIARVASLDTTRVRSLPMAHAADTSSTASLMRRRVLPRTVTSRLGRSK